MKSIKKIMKLFVCVLILGMMCVPVFASQAVSGTLSADCVKTGEEFTITVSISEFNASSIGISITCDDSLEVVDGQWLKNGLIASFDPAKNKAVFTPGGTAVLSGDIFQITLRAKSAAKRPQSVSIVVIVKNATNVLLEETVTKSVKVFCAKNTFGAFDKNANGHWRTCTVCGSEEPGSHKWDSGNITNNANCQTAGEKTYTCAECEFTKTEIIAKPSHKYSDGSCTQCGASDPNAPAVTNSPTPVATPVVTNSPTSATTTAVTNTPAPTATTNPVVTNIPDPTVTATPFINTNPTPEATMPPVSIQSIPPKETPETTDLTTQISTPPAAQTTTDSSATAVSPIATAEPSWSATMPQSSQLPEAEDAYVVPVVIVGAIILAAGTTVILVIKRRRAN